MTQALPSRRAVLSGLTALALLATPASAQNVSGVYRAEGRNPDGSSYTGTVEIQDNGGTIEMQWRIASQSYSGSGSRNGDVVWVNWGQTHPVVYVRMPSGELHGTWGNGRALERLIP
ncbi:MULTISPECIES: LIC10280 family protein [Leisingera]|uniref:LIC10280 family protein n=1 Tax=Leisingera TaxID=191028 RepID=UPI0004177F22|nr:MULTISPECIES: hypothetical protein [Leisingera]